MNNTTKRWFLSTLVTFFAGFAITLLANIDSLTLESLKDGSVVGLFFVAVRSGVKMALELFLNWYSKR